MNYEKIVSEIPRTAQIIDALYQRLAQVAKRHEKAMEVIDDGDRKDLNRIIWMVEVVPAMRHYCELLKAYGEEVPYLE